ncbi:hypothetical protein [Massilia sp. Se16.2.3]|nr:hypothetical protein [Massilia sp. Se16.2.3]
MERRNDYKTALLIDAVIHRPEPARALAGMGVPLRRGAARADQTR